MSSVNKIRVLVLEDSKLINSLITKELINADIDVISSYSIKNAIEYLEKESFDFITVDLTLPDGNGEDIIKLVNERFPKTNVIVITANDDEVTRHKLFNLSIIDYYVKDNFFKDTLKYIVKKIKSIDDNYNFTILIIDSIETDRKNLKKVLKDRNYDAKSVKNAKEAELALTTFSPNLIITDIELDDVNSLEFIQQLNTNNIEKIPIIVLSNNHSIEVIRKCYMLKVVEFLHKPMFKEEIYNKVSFWQDKYLDTKILLHSNKILQEYRNAIDESSIVSKADHRGFITFVNKAFCNISGYTEYELVGNAHSILRHEDTRREVFEDMWSTIKNKKTWNGIIKNKKKDGSHYWVDTTIKPILNNENKIVEYISIRNDVTELEDSKEVLNNALEEGNQTLESQMNYIVQYEDAVSKSSSVIRLGTDYKITYVNDNYEKLTGYSYDELFGKEHLEVCSQNKNTNDIIKSAEKHDIRKEVFKGTNKDGEEFYTITTIAPILDKKENIVEYLLIKNDISTEINLLKEIEDTQKEVVFTMGAIGETRSKETGLHVKRVAEYSYLLAKLYGLSEEDAKLIKQASPMHDIGKVGIPDSILNKPGKLDYDEFEIMKTHAHLGYEMLKSSKRAILQTAAKIARGHHEKWNGSGYPNGLKGEEIEICARITAVADVFDALGHSRVYKKAWHIDDILEYFKNESGKHFEPKLISIVFDNLDKFLEIQKSLSD